MKAYETRPSRNKKPVNQKMIREIQKAVYFNPTEPGPMKILVEMDNPEYYELRAVEMIREAQELRKNSPLTAKTLELYDEKLILAIRLIILAETATM